MKNKLILIISILFIIPFILIVKSMAAESNCTQEQKAIQEVADAYYQRGINAQYCHERKSLFYSPEEGTTQHTIYSVCSDFTFSTYYQAFGIKLPTVTSTIIAYAYTYYNPNNITTNDVIEYWEKTKDENNNVIYKDNKGNEKDIDLSTEDGRKKYATKILKEYNLQVGDIICCQTGEQGHAVLVYDIIYDEKGEPIDAIIRESGSKFEKNTTKLTKRIKLCRCFK